MNRPMRMLIASTLAAGLCACAAIDSATTPKDAHIWRPGVTTEAQIIDALGQPAETAYLPDGKLLLCWRGLVGVKTRERSAYGFVFTPQGLLVRQASHAEVHAPGL